MLEDFQFVYDRQELEVLAKLILEMKLNHHTDTVLISINSNQIVKSIAV